MDGYRHSLPTFRPYREGGLTPLTLREELRDRYLKEAVEWLLWSTEMDKPMRAQELDSPWQTAWCVLECLEARSIFEKDGAHLDLVEAIDGKILGAEVVRGTAHWLLDKAEEDRSLDGTLIHWDHRLFDTAIVSRALLQIHIQYYRMQDLHGGNGVLRRCVPSTVARALRWLCERWTRRDALDLTENDALSEALLTFVLAKSCGERQFDQILGGYERSLGADPLSALCAEICSRSRELSQWKGNETDTPLVWDDHATVMRGLSAFYAYIGQRSPEEAIRLGTLLLRGLLYLEVQLREGFAEHGPRSKAIGAYVQASSLLTDCGRNPEAGATGQPQADTNLIMASIYKSCSDAERFEDGSVFHDLYSTMYYVHMLTRILRHFTPVEKPVIRLHDEALWAITRESRVSLERRQVYALRSSQQALRLQIATMQKRLNLHKTALVMTVAVICVAGFSLYIWRPMDLLGYVGAVSSAMAIVSAGIAWLLDRIWGKRGAA